MAQNRVAKYLRVAEFTNNPPTLLPKHRSHKTGSKKPQCIKGGHCYTFRRGRFKMLPVLCQVVVTTPTTAELATWVNYYR